MLGLIFAQSAPVVDSLCVSGALGTEALSAIATAGPVQYGFNVIAALGGIGCGVVISRCSGSGEKEKAARAFTRTLIAMTAATLFFSIFLLIHIEPLLRILCATPENFTYVKEYLRMILAGAVFIVLNFAGDYLLANDNNEKLAMAGDITGAVVNMAVDFIGVYVFRCGIWVVGFGTALGSFCCTLVYLLHFRKKDRLCRIVLPKRKEGDPRLFEIAKPGAAEALMYALLVLRIVSQNYVLRDDGGTSGLGNSAVIENLGLILMIVVAGATNAVFPMASAYHGEQNRSGTLMVKKTLAETGLRLLLVPVILISLFPGIIILPFRVSDPVMLKTLPFAIRIVCMNHLLIYINTLLTACLSAVEEEGKASLAYLIQSLVEIPMILLLNRWSDMNSPWYAAVIAQTAVMVYLFFFCGGLSKGLWRYCRENLLLLRGGKLNAGFTEALEKDAGKVLTGDQLSLVKQSMLSPLLAALPAGRSPAASFTVLTRDDSRKAAILRYDAKTDFLEEKPGMSRSYDEEENEEDSEIPYDTCIRSEFLGMRRLMIVFGDQTTEEEQTNGGRKVRRTAQRKALRRRHKPRGFTAGKLPAGRRHPAKGN